MSTNFTEGVTVNTLGEGKRVKPMRGFQLFLRNFKRCWQLHLIMVAPLIYLALFEYLPLYGIQIVFKDYNSRQGIWNSPWVGLENFYRFFEDRLWFRYVWNTFYLSFYNILTFPIAIIFALILHVNEHKILKKVTQNVSYIPHFISTVIMVGMLQQLLHPMSGLLGAFANQFGWKNVPNVLQDPEYFADLYVWSGKWQSFGWSAILYVAALSNVPSELHEAATLDGASRLHRVWYVDLPTIMPTVTMMFIMQFGGILSVGYDKVLLMQNDVNKTASEVISTYVYRQGIGSNKMSYATAISLLNTCINTGMMFLMNGIVKLLGDEDTQTLF